MIGTQEYVVGPNQLEYTPEIYIDSKNQGLEHVSPSKNEAHFGVSMLQFQGGSSVIFTDRSGYQYSLHGSILLMAEILHHLGCMKPYKYRDKLPIN